MGRSRKVTKVVDVVVDAEYPIAPQELYKLMFDSDFFVDFLETNQKVHGMYSLYTRPRDWLEVDDGLQTSRLKNGNRVNQTTHSSRGNSNMLNRFMGLLAQSRSFVLRYVVSALRAVFTICEYFP